MPGFVRYLIIALVFFSTSPIASVFAQSNAIINLNPNITYQTITGWEATAQSGQDFYQSLFPKYKDALYDKAVNELGINRLRVEIASGVENPTDNFLKFVNNPNDTTEREWSHIYSSEIINDNNDPNVINPSGFHFSSLDTEIEKIALPIKRLLRDNGNNLYLNINYVDFRDNCTNTQSCYEHYNSPEEYSEFVLATYQHLKNKYNLLPDAWEMILEPDNSPWGQSGNGTRIGRAMYASAVRLKNNGFIPRFIAPSVTNMNNLMNYISGIKAGIKQQGNLTDTQVTQFLKDNVEELSYHRYGQNDGILPALISESGSLGVNTSQLEHIGADYNELHNDLKDGNNSAWQQYTIAWPGGTDDGGAYFLVDNNNNPNPRLSTRAKYFRQYFHFISRGARRIEAATTNNAFDPVAFINNDGKWVVVVKAGSAGTLSINGLPSGTYGISYITTQTQNISPYYSDPPDQSVSNQQLTATIPAQGVITIYGKTHNSTPPPTQTPVPFFTPTSIPTVFSPSPTLNNHQPTASLPSPTHNPQPTTYNCITKGSGDADCNGHVDIFDYNIFVGEFIKTYSTKNADFDSSDEVDLVDFEILRSNYF